MSREKKFGRILSVANVIGEKVLPKGHPGIAAKYMGDLQRKPADTFARMHNELMQNAHKLGPDENMLMEILGEEVASLDIEEMNNKRLEGDYIVNYYHKNTELDSVMGVEEASKKWGLSAGYIKNLCSDGEIAAKKIGMSWIIPSNHPNPKVRNG